MDASAANSLFDAIKAITTDQTTAEARFLDYCKNVLGSVEGLHFDFKEKSDRTTPKLGDPEKENLARAISGFANTSGGIIIWGVEDKTVHGKPIRDPAGFLDNLLAVAPAAVDPTVPAIQGHSFLSPSGDVGYAIV